MENVKFTKGEWKVRTESTSTGEWPEVYVEGAYYDDGSEFVVAELGTTRTRERASARWTRQAKAYEVEANALLIAAAPDLYEALLDAPNPANLSPAALTRVYYNWFDRQRQAAIAKAGGSHE